MHRVLKHFWQRHTSNYITFIIWPLRTEVVFVMAGRVWDPPAGAEAGGGSGGCGGEGGDGGAGGDGNDGSGVGEEGIVTAIS